MVYIYTFLQVNKLVRRTREALKKCRRKDTRNEEYFLLGRVLLAQFWFTVKKRRLVCFISFIPKKSLWTLSLRLLKEMARKMFLLLSHFPQWLEHCMVFRPAYEWEVKKKLYLEWDTRKFAIGTRPAGIGISFPLFPQKLECQTVEDKLPLFCISMVMIQLIGPTRIFFLID